MLTDNRDFKGVWIPKEIWLNENLTITEKVIFVEIDSLDNENHCIASNEYFAKFCDCSESKVTKAISKLQALGMIEVISFDGRHRKIRVVKSTEQGSKKYEAESEKVRANNIDNKLNNNIVPKGKDTLSLSESSLNTLSDYESKMYSEEVKEKRKRERVEDIQPVKKLSLWDKCVQHIEEFTDDEKLQDALKQYLTVRLAMRDKPLYAPQWKALLKKIPTLKGDRVQIVLQAAQGGWLSFYDEKKNDSGYYRGKSQYDTFSEHAGMKSTKVSNEEYEEIMKYGQKF